MHFLNLVALSALGVCMAERSHEAEPRRQDTIKSPDGQRSRGATKKYIIEVDRVRYHLPIAIHATLTPSSQSADRGSFGRRLKSNLQETITSKGGYYNEFNCEDLFVGVSIESEVDNVDSLLAMEGVANVWPMRSVPMAAPIGSGKVMGPETKLSNYSVHQWTGVDKLHAKGIRGKGVTVAIIDTGIDYTHKAVGAPFLTNQSTLTWTARRLLWTWMQSSWRI